jgi:hypothetical protein
VVIICPVLEVFGEEPAATVKNNEKTDLAGLEGVVVKGSAVYVYAYYGFRKL